MKNIYLAVTLLLFSITFSMSSYAISNFSSGTGVLVVPRVDFDGNTYYDNVSLELNLETGTFTILNATPTIPPKPDQIIETQTVEKFSLGFQGCFRAGRNEVHCYMKITNTDFDKSLGVNVSGFANLQVQQVMQIIQNCTMI